MIVIYFVLFNLKRNRVKHRFRNTAEPSDEICIFKSLTCYWWWFNSIMNCISSLYARLFWMKTQWVPDSAVFTLARLITSTSALFWQHILAPCPDEFHPWKLTDPVETELRCFSSFLWAVISRSWDDLSQLVALEDQVLGDHLPVNAALVFSANHS